MLFKGKNIVIICWIAFIVMLIASLCSEFLMKHPHIVFGIEGTLFFNAWYGFGACVAIVLVSKILGFILKRRETYYDGDSNG